MQAVDRARSVAALVENHRAFLRYLERRTGDRALAEDILQDAFAKVVSRPESAPTDEAIIPWFYRGLRNAAVDQFRRRGASVRAYEASAKELETRTVPSDELKADLCLRVAAGIDAQAGVPRGTRRH
jgi:RNA polymerase sigma-70 factor (ECF subfamily)